MPNTPNEEKALSDHASAFAQHLLNAMKAQNTDTGFQEALVASSARLNLRRKRVRELGMLPLQ
jgi:hypothetical protein